MPLIIVVSFIIIGVYVIINIIDEEFDLKDYIYFILITLGIFLGGIIEDYKQESQNSSKSKIDYTKNSEVLNSIDTLVTYRDSVLLIFK
jgi:UDP-N-acetylmuramyl pentapeptide phosphotransferase/UDP-N-acetylglucosamine-1-phosphate transferase